MLVFRLPLLFALLGCAAVPVCAQGINDSISEAEVETLRDASFVPMDSMAAYEKILNARQKRMADLLAKRPYPGRQDEMHDLMDQFAAIVDEFTDHLENYRKQRRDIRKALPKLLQETDRWATALRAPPDDSAYNIVRKIALDNLKDLHDEAADTAGELETYFKAHPEAAKAEHDRLGHEHDATRDPPR